MSEPADRFQDVLYQPAQITLVLDVEDALLLSDMTFFHNPSTETDPGCGKLFEH